MPLVHKDAVYVYGPGGMLHAVAVNDGKLRWSRDTAEDFEADVGYFGFGSTPVVLGDKLVVNVGGRAGVPAELSVTSVPVAMGPGAIPRAWHCSSARPSIW